MNSTSESAIAAILVLSAFVIAAVSVRSIVSDIQRRVRILGAINTKLDLLLENAGIEFDPYKDLPREIVEAVQRGNKIEAIKRYRTHTGAGLREAKNFIEEVQRKAGV